MTKEKIIVKDKEELINLIEKEIQENGNKCDLNHLDISKITSLSYLFYSINFNGNISKWDTSKVIDMKYLFSNSEFNGDISKWNVSNVEDMDSMFFNSYFNRYEDLNNWKPFRLFFNNLFNNNDNKKIYWSSKYINLMEEDIRPYIEKYWTEKEKELLIEQNKNYNLSCKRDVFKL